MNRKSSNRLVLASGSPRRRELLRLLGLSFTTRPVDIPENREDGETPDEFVARMALRKSRAAAPTPGEVVIAADTIVVLEDDVLGKPDTEYEALEMLRRLRGQAHQVETGLTVSTDTMTVVEIATTTVWMRDYSDEELRAYIARGQPFDKAGGYAIQDEIFRPVAHYQGCPMNVMGLPLCRLTAHLRIFGVSVPVAPKEVCRIWFGEECEDPL